MPINKISALAFNFNKIKYFQKIWFDALSQLKPCKTLIHVNKIKTKKAFVLKILTLFKKKDKDEIQFTASQGLGSSSYSSSPRKSPLVAFLSGVRSLLEDLHLFQLLFLVRTPLVAEGTTVVPRPFLPLSFATYEWKKETMNDVNDRYIVVAFKFQKLTCYDWYTHVWNN